MTTTSRSSVFSTAAGPTSGAVVNAYKASRFSGTPARDDAPPPAGSPDAGPVTSGDSFGGPGQFTLALPTNEDYWFAVSYAGHIYWKFSSPSSFSDTDGKTTTLYGDLDMRMNSLVNLPDPVNPQGAVAGRESAATGKTISGQYTSTTTLNLFYYDNTFCGGNGVTLNISGTYEAA